MSFNPDGLTLHPAANSSGGGLIIYTAIDRDNISGGIEADAYWAEPTVPSVISAESVHTAGDEPYISEREGLRTLRSFIRAQRRTRDNATPAQAEARPVFSIIVGADSMRVIGMQCLHNDTVKFISGNAWRLE